MVFSYCIELESSTIPSAGGYVNIVGVRITKSWSMAIGCCIQTLLISSHKCVCIVLIGMAVTSRTSTGRSRVISLQDPLSFLHCVPLSIHASSGVWSIIALMQLSKHSAPSMSAGREPAAHHCVLPLGPLLCSIKTSRAAATG
jgi:hypothetical protein